MRVCVPEKEGPAVLMNVRRAKAIMAERGLDGLVASSAENITYASGYTNWMIYALRDLEAYVVVPQQGEAAIVIPVHGADYLAQKPADVSRVYTYGAFYKFSKSNAVFTDAEARLLEIRERANHQPNGLGALKQALADCGLIGCTIGVDERGMPPSRWRMLTEELEGTRIVEANDVFRTVRMVKTEEEINRLQHAARVLEDAMSAAFEIAAPGVTEADLEGIFRSSVAAAGADPGHFETASGSRGGGNFPSSSQYRIQPGDVIRSDCGCRYLGYWADTSRTAAVGDPSPVFVRYYEALKTGFIAVLAATKPGVQVKELFRLGTESVRESGIPHYQRQHVGHGIGLEFYEAPMLVEKMSSSDIHRFGSPDMRLEENMVINIELPYYELGLGGLHLEKTVVVRPGGYDLLTRSGLDMYYCAAKNVRP